MSAGADPRSRFIVHVVPDDKFIDMACREFEAVAPGLHRFIIVGGPRPLRYISSPAVTFRSLSQAARLFRESGCAGIVFHSLGELYALEQAPADKPIVWIGWGYDYYDRLLSGAHPEGLLMPRTRELWCRKPRAPVSWLSRFRAAAGKVLRRPTPPYSQLLSKVGYFAPVIDVEHELACRLNPWFRPQLASWNYGTIEDDLSVGGPSAESPGRNILVGNSATFENNHLEVFELVERQVDLAGRKIIVPLSYGDDWYRDQVIQAGRRQFGDLFMPLTRFLPQEEYLDLLQGCGHVFMDHLRQQALGNICIMMLKGARIYMNAASPLYRWLSERGARITPIDVLEDDRRAAQRLAPLTQEDRQINREVVRKHWSRDVQRERTRQLVEALLGKPQAAPR